MNANANNLIGKKVQKVESTKRGVVAEVKEGWTAGTTILVFADGYKGMYSDRDIESMLVDGKHLHHTR